MKKKLLIITIPIFLILTSFIMDKTRDKIWFQEVTLIDCNVEDVNKSLRNIGDHYKQLISEYPGMTAVELIDQGNDFVTIKTNEGTMKRTNISVNRSESKIIIELDEEYITSAITTNSHIVEKFDRKDDIIELQIEISNLKAPGFLGFFLRNFGSKNIGNGFLDSYKKILEK
ncbi:MAG: hypothetical protein H8E98_04200 [Bacteroidetes bacterium]|nr:hypothetical protein [Bacteroidota bacterium]